jgi:CrcB protein
MLLYLLIACGGALGSVARFWINGLVSTQTGAALFPWGTFLVNVTGSFIIGFFFAISEPGGRVFVSSNARQFFMTGICGGYTTFSSFSLQTLNLAREGEWLHAGANVVGSVVACLVAVWLGHVAASSLNR